MIREALAGRRIAVTGATGFLGTALVERLVRTVPDCQLVLLVRPGRRASPAAGQPRDAQERLLRSPRRELGDRFDAEMAARVTPIAGDVATDGLGLDDDGPASVLATCATVIHSAAAVSFDSPLDGAVEVNLLGPTRVAPPW